ncbi:MAG TPA: patatin-like phospholipase family protein [Mucilaginibacter sp.]|jgi:predicted acylesterase/phospholipase RssA|nr:patatin-like phospholipase family protein [Mucilaginibacter sp.]
MCNTLVSSKTHVAAYSNRKKHFSGLIVLISLLIIQTGYAQVKVIVNSDIHYEPILPVSLDAYKSVQDRDNSTQNPKLGFGVAISGGGSRAQYFGLGVLMGLEQIKDPAQGANRNLLNDVDYFSTASGGGFAAGYYLTIKKNVLLAPDKTFNSFGDFWLSRRRIDELQEFIWQSAEIWDFILKFKGYERNSRKSMPEVIDQQLLQYDPTPGSKKFSERMRLKDFFVSVSDSRQPTLPMFVANGTVFNNVERLPFMPHILKGLDVNRSLEPVDNSFENNPAYEFPLTYAISGSAAFPGILPQVQLGLASTNTKVIRIVDGGVVDNLGYKTLIELLSSDHKVTDEAKRALIIDCSAVGEAERYSDKGIASQIGVLKSALLFTVDSKYVTRKEDIENDLIAHHIPLTNYLMVGFNTLKKRLMAKDTADDRELIELRKYLRQDAGQTESSKASDNRWLELLSKFEASVKLHCKIKNPNNYVINDDNWQGNELRTIDLITFDDFKNFTLADDLMLYELASQIETKMKIYKSEKIILTLAGKYVVYLEQNKLNQLYHLN